MNITSLRRAFANANVKAFYAVLRHTESSNKDDAYTLVNLAAPDDPARGVKGHHFSDFSKHPYDGLLTTKGGYAAGAGQFIPSTWRDEQKKYGFPSFAPEFQDLAYVGRLIYRDALDDVMAGRFETALAKCKLEWTSLPGASESRAKWTMAKARDLYLQYGGRLDEAPVPQPVGATGTPPPLFKRKETSIMGALALLPLLAQFIPQIISLIKPNSESTAKDAAIAQTILNAATQAAGVLEPGQQATAAQVGAAVDAMQADPKLAQDVQKAVVTDPEIMGLLEVGGGIVKAREFSAAMQTADKPFWYNPTFWVTMAFFPMLYMIAASILFTVAPDAKATMEQLATMAWYQKIGFDLNTRTGALNIIIGFVFGGVIGMWFGTSYGSLKKDAMIAAKV